MVLELSVFHIAILFGAAVLLVLAAVSDAQRYRIPNWVCAALLLLFPFFVLTAPGAVEWSQHLMVFGLMLISGFAMFIGNIAGAGDIKLLAVTGLWAGPHLVAVFLVTTAIAGGFLALVMALLTHFRNRSGRSAVALAKIPIPYGIAISIGGLAVLSLLSQPILFPG
jgi:prepilin peptidase CpaA